MTLIIAHPSAADGGDLDGPPHEDDVRDLLHPPAPYPGRITGGAR